MSLGAEVWGLFVTQLIHPGLTETVCTYLISKYSGLGTEGGYQEGAGNLEHAPLPNSGKKHWFIVGTQEKVGQRAGVGGWHTQPHREH